jgi:nucleotide-binding universal stress UspA family protein
MSILVPVDFSAISERVCRVAAEAAKARGTKIWLIHVAEPEPEFVGYEPGPDVVRDQVASELRNEHRQLQELADRTAALGVEVTPLLIQGSTVETILEQADHHAVEMIVMATHGRGLMYQMLVGSVSEGVLHRTKVPILLVPAREP